MLGIGGRPQRQPAEGLPAALAHGRRQRRRVEPWPHPLETVAIPTGRLAEIGAELPRADALADERGVAGLEPERHLAADRLQAAGELAHPPLARVVADEPPAGAPGQPHRRLRQPGRAVLRADQVRLGDGDLLGLAVAGQLDDLEPVAQRRRDPVGLVRRRDEEHLREVERQLDEGVAEAGVLLGVEHLEQHLGRLPAELVDLVEHDDRVLRAEPPELAQDDAGLRILPRPVVAPQVRLVAQPPAGQPREPAPERPGRALRERRLADPGRADEADHRARAARGCAGARPGARGCTPWRRRGPRARRRAPRGPAPGRPAPRCAGSTAASRGNRSSRWSARRRLPTCPPGAGVRARRPPAPPAAAARRRPRPTPRARRPA